MFTVKVEETYHVNCKIIRKFILMIGWTFKYYLCYLIRIYSNIASDWAEHSGLQWVLFLLETAMNKIFKDFIMRGTQNSMNRRFWFAF